MQRRLSCARMRVPLARAPGCSDTSGTAGRLRGLEAHREAGAVDGDAGALLHSRGRALRELDPEGTRILLVYHLRNLGDPLHDTCDEQQAQTARYGGGWSMDF